MGAPRQPRRRCRLSRPRIRRRGRRLRGVTSCGRDPLGCFGPIPVALSVTGPENRESCSSTMSVCRRPVKRPALVTASAAAAAAPVELALGVCARGGRHAQ